MTVIGDETKQNIFFALSLMMLCFAPIGIQVSRFVGLQKLFLLKPSFFFLQFILIDILFIFSWLNRFIDFE
jgi:hypothetical protein